MPVMHEVNHLRGRCGLRERLERVLRANVVALHEGAAKNYGTDSIDFQIVFQRRQSQG